MTLTVDSGTDIYWVLRNIAKMSEDILIFFLNDSLLSNFHIKVLPIN